jgi:hypothetical protein
VALALWPGALGGASGLNGLLPWRLGVEGGAGDDICTLLQLARGTDSAQQNLFA